MAVEELKPFNAIKYTTSYGENCTATKKDGIVTIQGDKNGVRQMPLDKFWADFIKDQSNKKLERTPNNDTLSFSGSTKNLSQSNKSYEQKLKKQIRKGNILSLLGTAVGIGSLYELFKPNILTPPAFLVSAFVSIGMLLAGGSIKQNAKDKFDIYEAMSHAVK